MVAAHSKSKKFLLLAETLLPAGEGLTAFVDARDIVAVGLLAASVEDAVHIVTGPEALFMSDVASVVSAATGSRVQYRPIRPEDAERVLRDRGAGTMAGFLTEHYTAMSKGRVRPRHRDRVPPYWTSGTIARRVH